MLRRFRAVIQSNKEPEDKHVLWYYKGVLYYFEDSWMPFNVSQIKDVKVHIDSLPNIRTLQEALEYLAQQSKSYKIVNYYNDLESLDPNTYTDGTHCYVVFNKKEYVFSSNYNAWIEDNTISKEGYPFHILSEKVLVTYIDNDYNITLSDYDFGNVVFFIAYGDKDARTVQNLNIAKLELVNDSWKITTSGIYPNVGQYVTIVASDRFSMVIPVIEEKDKDGANTTCFNIYTNTPDSIFESYVQLDESLININYDLNNLSEVVARVEDHQKEQDHSIQENTQDITDLDRKIDAKVIEAGGVPFDQLPTEDSTNAVFSGGVYKYIEKKFQVLTQEEYEQLVKKDPETFYFVLE